MADLDVAMQQESAGVDAIDGDWCLIQVESGQLKLVARDKEDNTVIPVSVIKKNNSLSGILSSGREGEDVRLHIKREHVVSWLNICETGDDSALKCLSAETVSIVLMAADIMGDEQTIKRVCKAQRICFKLALERRFRALPADPRSPVSGMATSAVATSDAQNSEAVQVLNTLPETLAISLLRAAFCGWAASPYHGPQHVRLPPALCTLPPPLHAATVMRACDPCIQGNRSLCLSLFQPGCLDATLATEALASLTNLTSVSLNFGEDGGGASGWNREYSNLIRAVCRLAHLATLTLDLKSMPIGVTEECPLAGSFPIVWGLRRLVFRAEYVEPASARALLRKLPEVFPSLSCLDLERCGICEEGAEILPGTLTSLSALQDLRLGSRYLSDEAAAAIAESVTNLPHLSALRFSEVALRLHDHACSTKLATAVCGLATALCELHIQHFCEEYTIAHGLVSALKQHCSALKHITCLNLNGSVQATDVVTGDLAALLCGLPGLQMLSLRSNDIVWGEEVCEVTTSLAGLKGLTELDLAGTRIQPAAAKHLGTALLEMTALQVLDVSDTRPVERGSNEQFVAAAKVLGPCMARLRELRACCCCLYGVGGAKALCSALPMLPALRVLLLKGDKLGGQGSRLLSGALHACSSLEVLDVSHNNIDDKSLGVLLCALRAVPGLKELLVNGNRFGDPGAEQLARWLENDLSHVGGLAVLGVAQCGVGDAGLSKLVPQLLKLPQLRELHLRSLVSCKVLEDEVESLQAHSTLLYVK